MTAAARLRRLWWKRVRRYDSELCGRHDHPNEGIRRGCGRPVGVVWTAPTGIWNWVVTGDDRTEYQVRRGVHDRAFEERAEGVGGTLCLRCFDRLARERGAYFRWTSVPL